MKRILSFIAILPFFVASCSGPQDPGLSARNHGVITGHDNRRCSCCGGWFIDIEGTTYRFTELPANSDVKLTETNFPIPVQVIWSQPTPPNDCSRDIITIYAMVKE